MTGNLDSYQQAMQDGDNAAWDQDWSKAIGYYQQAIKLRPQESTPYNNMGLALLNAERFEDALKIYDRAHSIAPDDPIPLEKSADVLERLGRSQDAVQKYIAVGDLYLRRPDLDKAIRNYERATRITPGLSQIHYRLAQAYERIGQKREAVREYLMLAYYFQQAKDKTKALQAAERARSLEPNNADVLNSTEAIKNDIPMRVPDVGRFASEVMPTLPEEAIEFETPSHADGPLGEATEQALKALAELVFSDFTPATAIVSQGIELQEIGEYSDAVNVYRQAESAGMRDPALYMVMGSALVNLEEWQEAEKSLLKANADKDYMAGAAHGLGKAYLGLGLQYKATDKLLSALQTIDTSIATSNDELSESAAVYGALLKTSQRIQEADLKQKNQYLLKWLTRANWKDRVVKTRRALAERRRNEGDDSLWDYVQPVDISDIVEQIDRYMKQGLLTLAMDEAFHAIEIEPTFLPVHQRVAQILMEEGRIQAAIVKYNTIANSFLARDSTAQAAKILNEVIAVAPTDVNLRTSLIELLERQNEWTRVIDEYISLADAHAQLADMEQAKAAYNEALRLAVKNNATPQKRAEVYRRMAEIDMNRLELRQALRNYEQVRTLTPDDEPTRRALIDIHTRLNNHVEAMKELDGLLGVFAQQRRGDQIVATLEQLVAATPNEMALRKRLGEVYQKMNRRTDAIAQFDVLGELQLDAGLYQDACATIKQIIGLQPTDMEQYRNLLAQLGC